VSARRRRNDQQDPLAAHLSASCPGDGETVLKIRPVCVAEQPTLGKVRDTRPLGYFWVDNNAVQPYSKAPCDLRSDLTTAVQQFPDLYYEGSAWSTKSTTPLMVAQRPRTTRTGVTGVRSTNNESPARLQIASSEPHGGPSLPKGAAHITTDKGQHRPR
jgi:hypothetical protein